MWLIFSPILRFPSAYDGDAALPRETDRRRHYRIAGGRGGRSNVEALQAGLDAAPGRWRKPAPWRSRQKRASRPGSGRSPRHRSGGRYAQTEWNYKNNGEKVVYLTFDDGPSKNTQRVLDILDQYGAKATFFVVGHDPDHYDMIKKAYDDGNTIGLHSYTHDYAKVYASEDAYFDDLDQIAQVVSDQIGYVPYLVRFPGGSSNTISEKYCSGIMDALVNDVQARGYQYYDWNASSGDGAVCTTDQIIQNSCAYDDYPNIILLCHDAATKDTTVEALPKIIEHYQALGYQFKAIDRSTMVPHHRVAN